MKVFMAHNFYQQPGGEDRSFAAEADMLEAAGHTVHRYTRHNDEINDMSTLGVAAATLWSRKTYRELRALFQQERFDVAHFQNTFPLISPAAYYAARAEGIPVVQTLRNYRLVCPNAIFFRDGRVCEDCMGKAVPYPGVQHACYRGSRGQSAAVAGMLTLHRARGTWKKQVNRYISLTHFARDKFIEAGFDPAHIVVKPNFLTADPGYNPDRGDYAVFIGRLTYEKGVMTLLKAWEALPNIPLKIIGDGPIMDEAAETIAHQDLHQVELLGRMPPVEALEVVKGARALVFPSEWYETFGRVAIEAFACGVPVIASRIGAIAEVVDHEQTGYLFNPGDSDDLARQVRALWDDPDRVAQMSSTARQTYEEKYTPASNLAQLEAIYQSVIDEVT